MFSSSGRPLRELEKEKNHKKYSNFLYSKYEEEEKKIFIGRPHSENFFFLYSSKETNFFFFLANESACYQLNKFSSSILANQKNNNEEICFELGKNLSNC